METLLFILFLAMITYGFIMSQRGRDIIRVAISRPEQNSASQRRRPAQRNFPAKETIANRRANFGLRQR